MVSQFSDTIFFSIHKNQMRRMVLLMKEVYGLAQYEKRNKFDWEALAEKCCYFTTSVQGTNECGHYVLWMASVFDGEQIGRAHV